MVVRATIRRVVPEERRRAVRGRIGESLGFATPPLGVELANRVLVGTHHKTGSVWLSSIFRRVCRAHGWSFFKGPQAELPPGCDVFVQDHSRFDLESLGPSRGVHLVRDPRDVVVSACDYHQRATEDWLHRPRRAFDGLTYQEKINSYDRRSDRLLFEMEHASGRTIRDLVAWDYDTDVFLEVRYEDLIVDTELWLFHEIFDHLGFPGAVLPHALAIAHRNSLFSGRVVRSHVTSGERARWRTELDPALRRRFVELFPDVLGQLGYEHDESWVEDT